MNNYEVINHEEFIVRRNRYISVLTAVICLAIVSITVIMNNNANSSSTIEMKSKFREFNLIETVVIPATTKPTRKPTEPPTSKPTTSPTNSPTKLPTNSPTDSPTYSPTTSPSLKPSHEPSIHPTPYPTSEPSKNPTPQPSDFPTKSPRFAPTHRPTKAPRPNPTQQPTKTPHGVPSKKPTDWSNTYHPTLTPIFVPTVPPTKSPVFPPTNTPTKSPRVPPTHAPHDTAPPTVCTCVNSFINSLPSYVTSFVLGNPVNYDSYSEAHIVTEADVSFSLPIWCVNYFQPVFAGLNYNVTAIYTWQEIIDSPSAAYTVPNPIRLNQVAWIVNNILKGDTAIGPQIYNGLSIDNCGIISASDIQAAIWLLMNEQCTLTQDHLSCDESIIISDHTPCNTAFIYNAAFAAIPDGATYVIPTDKAGGVIVPLLLTPEGAQPFLVGATIYDWGYHCPCP